MGNCKYYDVCGLSDEADPKEGLCILHSQNSEKDQEAFASALKAHCEKNGNIYIRMVFPGITDFTGATFTGSANFYCATFTKDADFNRATFTEDTDFTAATFIGGASFAGATFTKDARFTAATFTRSTYFQDTTFTKGASFTGATFTKDARFYGAIFTEHAHFHRTIFTERANFAYATFTEDAGFNDTTFTKDARFTGATFSKNARFYGATFIERADFTGATITEDADLSSTIFSDKSYFNETIFRGGATFANSSFRDRAFFAGRLEKDQITLIFKDVVVDFRSVNIEKPEAIEFTHADLSNCLFQGTDLRKLRFIGIKWPQIAHREGIYDETFSGEKGVIPWNEIERLYRDLKKNYEDSRDFERAGEFHYGEKEMRRRNPETPLGIKFLLTLYWKISGYGERCVLPLEWVGVLLVISNYVLLLFECLEGKGGQLLTTTSGWDWISALIYSLRVMVLLKPMELELVSIWGTLITTIQSIFGPILIGLFTLAARQKLKR